MNSIGIPEGFEPHFRKSPFTDPWEPLYSKRTDKAVIIGLRLAKPHTNARGNVHGGLISALADAGDWLGIVTGDDHSCDRLHRHRPDRAMAHRGKRGDQNRQNDLLRAKPNQGRRQCNRSGERHISRGAEARG